MNYRMIFRIAGLVLLCLAGLLLLPLVAGLCYGESVWNFVITIGASAVLGLLLISFKPKIREIYAREGFVAVGLAWVLTSLVGALPFVINGDCPSYIDALFETVSGFTTTGASVFTDIESLSRGNMFWRLFTHWIGGMGVLVFIMAVLPMSGEHSMHIMRAEVPGPIVGKLVPRTKKTAGILYLIYAGMTLVETALLMCGGMSFYEALVHSFATAGTGGFSTRAASIAAFDSVYIEMVIAVFLVLFGLNFNLYFLLLIGRVRDVLKNEELRWFICIILGATLAMALGIKDMYGGMGTALRHSFFNTASIISTAGFGTEDFVTWPEYCKAIIVLLMFCGGCAGSTGGGLKVSRVIMLVKGAICDVRGILRPRSVHRVRLEGRPVEGNVRQAVSAFFDLYIMFLLVFTLIVSFDGYDFTTNFTAALSCLSNVGPGLGLVGPKGSFAMFSAPVKLALSFAMLLGRLELYALLALFFPRAKRG